MPEGRFIDEQHAHRSGILLGFFIKNGVPAVPVMDDEGNYGSLITITVPFKDEPLEIMVYVL